MIQRDSNGKYRKSNKPFYFGLLTFLIVLGGTLYYFGDKQVSTATTEASSTTEQVAQKDTRLQAMLDDKTNKELYEIQMTKKLILQDMKTEEARTASSTKAINEERDQKIRNEDKLNTDNKAKLKLKMDDALRREIELASTSKSGL
jgi:hypothetical protein